MRLSSVGLSILWIMVMVLPLFVVPNTFNAYEFPKFLLFVLLVWIVSVTSVVEKLRRSNLFSLTSMDKLVIGFGVVTGVADIIGIDPRTSLLGSSYRLQGFVLLFFCICFYFLIKGVITQKRNKNLFMICWLVGLFAVCLVVIAQGVGYFVFHDIHIPTYRGRIVGTMGNPNVLAGYVVTLLPFVLWYGKGRVVWIGKILFTIVIFVTLLFAQSRIGIATAVVIIPLYVVFQLQKKGKRNMMLLLVSSLVIIMVISIWFYHQQIAHIANSFFFATRESQWDNRILIWSEGISAFAKHPFLGIGQENYELIMEKTHFFQVDSAHNILLETGVATGSIGVLIFLAILFSAFKSATLPVKFSLIAFLTAALFNPLSIVQIVLFWYLVALADSSKVSTSQS